MFPVSPTGQLADKEPVTDQGQDTEQSWGAKLSADKYALQDGSHPDAWTRNSKIGSSSSREGTITQFPTNDTEPSESTALLKDGHGHTARNPSGDVSAASFGAESKTKVVTTWQRESLVLTTYSLPLMLTSVLEYSLTGASLIAVGHLGKTELGAVSLATMTLNVTGFCVYIGLATSLDTLCAQAYGSGKPRLVGLHFQRMVYFLWTITIPIGAIWFSGNKILLWITPEPECAELAGLYLKIMVLGAPGFALFEAGKRFVQAQGLFRANLYVLLICAPLNAFMNWLFVWVRNIASLS